LNDINESVNLEFKRDRTGKPAVSMKQEVPKMEEETCPECGCMIEENAFEKEGITYCCEACATGCECECGCIEEEECV